MHFYCFEFYGRNMMGFRNISFKKGFHTLGTCFFIWSLFFFPIQTFAQENTSTPTTDNQSSTTDDVLARVKSQLDQPSDSTIKIVFKLVQDQCGKDFSCLYELYQAIVKAGKQRKAYWQIVPIAEEMIRIAEEEGDVERVIRATEKLAGLYSILKKDKELNQARLRLLELYEQTGNQESYYRMNFQITEGSSWNLGEVDETLVILEDLLAEAQELNFSKTVTYMHIRLKYIYEENDRHDKFEETIEALEKIPMIDSLRAENILLTFHKASGRADLLLKEKKYEQAEKYYQGAREVVRLRHNPPYDIWLEVYVLLRLAVLEWERDRPLQTRIYLDTAYKLGVEGKLHYITTVVLAKQIEIAKKENRLGDALDYIDKKTVQQAKVDSVNQGFDNQRAQLELIRKKLTSDNEKQALALQLKDSQLRNIIVIAVLSFLLVVGLFMGLRKQWRDRRALAVQNQLIKQQSEELKELDAAKTRFFANVSHELRTPLTLMLGPLGTILKENSLSEKQIQLLQLTNQNGKQLQQLINEILDLGKLEMNTLEVKTESTELLSFFSVHTSHFDSLAASHQITYSKTLSIDKEIVASIDQEKCRQVLSNLLSNAFKFTPKGGQVGAKIFIQEGQLNVSVSDSGGGIHPDDLPHVFDRYFQANRPDQPISGGTGIGLALCKEYAKLFKGKIRVASKQGLGTTFFFSFPLVLNEIMAERKEISDGIAIPEIAPFQIPLKSLNAQKASILVVEDNVDIQRYLHLILADTYHLHIANHGKEALHYLEQVPSCDLILSDIMMPVMDGYQLLEKLKADKRFMHIPVVMLTARADVRDKLKALRIGVDDYLLKPFDEEELKVRLANLLYNQAIRREAHHTDEVSEKTSPGLSEEDQIWLESFEQYSKQHFSSDIFSIPAMAEEFAMSESTLLRQVKRLTGLSPSQYINEIRLDKARQLLENNTHNSITQVALGVGFKNPNTFYRAFKKRYGKKPTDLVNS